MLELQKDCTDVVLIFLRDMYNLPVYLVYIHT